MKEKITTASSIETPSEETTTNRRAFLGKLGKAAIVATAAAAAVPFIDSTAQVAAQKQQRSTLVGFDSQRATACYQLRVNSAQTNFSQATNFPRSNNGDEALYSNKIGNFSKGLPHQANGEVNLTAYLALLNALTTHSPADFELIAMGGDRKLTNPQSGLGFDMEGGDPFSFIQPPAPTFASKEEAAEIAENYWMALLRDVPFTAYGANPIAAAAAADLTLFGTDFKGPKDTGGNVTTNVLFRGLTAGDKAGPYMSQFWYLPIIFGANQIDQRIKTARMIADGGQNYMTDFNSWLSVQNGVTPPGDIFDPTPRYIRNGRDLGQWVHMDVLYQAYFQAFLIMCNTLFVPVDPGNPYSSSSSQMGFGTFGMPHISSLLCEVATRALKAVWNQKWFVHRRLRPEAFAERVDRTAYHSAGYPVHSEILASVASGSRLGGFLSSGNAFLPMAFPEGSPLHPAYGAGHATVAGACVTILKAWFDESFVIQNPLIPSTDGLTLSPYTGDTLTVGSELNKIASNVAIGRNIAGVHWRSDATESLKLGEAVAISILQDQKHCYNETFNGFSLTKFDGTTITV
jgi:hypothetical protein